MILARHLPKKVGFGHSCLQLRIAMLRLKFSLCSARCLRPDPILEYNYSRRQCQSCTLRFFTCLTNLALFIASHTKAPRVLRLEQLHCMGSSWLLKTGLSLSPQEYGRSPLLRSIVLLLTSRYCLWHLLSWKELSRSWQAVIHSVESQVCVLTKRKLLLFGADLHCVYL